MSKMEKKNQKNAKNAKNRASFLPSPVPPLNKGTGEGPKITEHSAECSAEWGTFGGSLLFTIYFKRPFQFRKKNCCCGNLTHLCIVLSSFTHQ